MTEKSYYHNGAVAGDAVEAPYTGSTYSKIINLTHSSIGGYVFPFYLNELVASIIHPGDWEVQIASGAAMVGGVFYTNSAAVTLTMSSNISNYARVDRVVIQVNWTTHTARLVIKTGRPAPIPTPPELIQIMGEIYEISLVRMYVYANFDPATDSFYIIDEREFANTATHENMYATENFFPDSEFMSDKDSGPLYASPNSVPAMWDFTGTPTATMYLNSTYSLTDKMDRGQIWDVTLPSSGADYVSFGWRLVNNPTTAVPVVFKLLMEVDAGVVHISDWGATFDAYVPVTKGMVEVLVRTTVAAGVASPNLLLQGDVDNTHFKLGQVTMTYGKIAAPFGTRHETVLYGCRSTAFGATALSTGSTQQSLNVRKRTYALWGYLSIYDTGSAGTNTCWASIQSNKGAADQLRVEIGRTPNNTARQNVGIVGIDPPTYTDPATDEEATLNVTASGANTLYASFYKTGIVI